MPTYRLTTTLPLAEDKFERRIQEIVVNCKSLAIAAFAKMLSQDGHDVTKLTLYAIRIRSSPKLPKPLPVPTAPSYPSNAYSRRGMIPLPNFLTRRKAGHIQRMRRQQVAAEQRKSGLLNYSSSL